MIKLDLKEVGLGVGLHGRDWFGWG